MKEIKIEINGKFGSKFQEQFARDSLMGILKAWKSFVSNAHKKNDICIEINNSNINHLEWFDWHKKKEL